MQKPTISNLKKIYNVLYNLPFAYEGGTSIISGQECTIGNYTYYLPGSEVWGIGDGAEITRFQPLTSGIQIKDRVSDLLEIKATFSEITDANSFILEVSLSANSDYDSTWISEYEDDFINKAFNIVTTLI